MEKIILNFIASEQSLKSGRHPYRLASGPVNYLYAKFVLLENWDGFDSIRAIWSNGPNTIAAVLDEEGMCEIPQEVLAIAHSKVKINLVGSISEGGVLTDRLTTYPIEAVHVEAASKLEGDETTPVTPSQFEQFVQIVTTKVAKIRNVDRVELNDDYTITFYYSDGTESPKIGPIRGETGADGNGIQSITKIGSEGRIDTYRIAYTNGEHFDFNVTNGEKGDRGEQGETGNGIDRIEKTATVGSVDTYTIYFTDGTTTTFDVTNGEVTKEELETLLPTETASGSIVSFPDGQSVFPMKSLKVSLDPIQDLHGYDKPWVGGAGKNKLHVTAITQTIKGVTFTVNSDGTVMVNGTATADARLVVGAYRADGTALSANGCPSGGSTSTYRMFFQYIGGDTGNGVSATPASGSNVEVAIQIYSGYTANNLLFKPMIRASGTDAAFAPWENICPIYGHDSVSAVVSPTTTASDGQTYTANLPQTVYGGWVDLVTGEGEIDRVIADVSTLTWSARPTWGGFRSVSIASDVKRPPTTSTLLANCKCSTYNQTTAAAIGMSTLYSYAIDTDGAVLLRVEDGKTASDITGQLVYPLATPIPFNIDPQTITTLYGRNNVWSEDGDVDVTYKADIQLYVDKKTNELAVAIAAL